MNHSSFVLLIIDKTWADLGQLLARKTSQTNLANLSAQQVPCFWARENFIIENDCLLEMRLMWRRNQNCRFAGHKNTFVNKTLS